MRMHVDAHEHAHPSQSRDSLHGFIARLHCTADVPRNVNRALERGT
jgi:hypothetical protein